MKSCEICESFTDVTNTKKVIDGQTIIFDYQDRFCRSCRGLVNYYTRIKKLDLTEVIQKLANQFNWLHKKPITDNSGVFWGY